MVSQRWYPMYEFSKIHRAMNRNWPTLGFTYDCPEESNWSIPLDVVEEGDDLLVRASLPGINPENIDVSIKDRVLSINTETTQGEEPKEDGYLIRERRHGSFHRSLDLPDTVDPDMAKTLYDNGVLTVTLPKAASKKAKRLKIAVGKE